MSDDNNDNTIDQEMQDTLEMEDTLEGVGDIVSSSEIIRRQHKLMAESREENNLLSDYLNYLWMIYADFQIMIVSPFVETKEPAVVIPPAYDKEKQIYENVYTIKDYGYAFRTSRGEEIVMGATAMGKLYNTIQKIIYLLMRRLEEQAGGKGSFDPQKEIKLALFGYELGKRKAFALIMDLEANVNIVNFDPRVWGERFIANLKNMIASGWGYPPDLKHVSERVAPPGSFGK